MPPGLPSDLQGLSSATSWQRCSLLPASAAHAATEYVGQNSGALTTQLLEVFFFDAASPDDNFN